MSDLSSPVSVLRLIRRAALGTVLVLPSAAFAQTEGDVALILDGSGSMWAPTEGQTPRINAARNLIGQLIEDWPAEREIALLAFGHRREADCGDVELIRSLAQADPEEIADALEQVEPLGRTAIGSSVRVAAEHLGYRDAPATVVVITDGVENCGVDLCALGEELAEDGAGFTAHVIGYGLTSEDAEDLACLPEATGGMLLTAERFGQLRQALGFETDAPVTAQIILEAVDSQTRRLLNDDIDWTIIDRDSGALMADPGSDARVVLDLAMGRYRIAAQGPDHRGAARISVDSDRRARYVIPLQRTAQEETPVVQPPDAPTPTPRPDRTPGEPVPDQASLTAPTAFPAGATVNVVWDGPGRPDDFITIVPRGARAGQAGDVAYTRQGSPLRVTAPENTGAHEIRYVDGRSGRTLASLPVTLTQMAARIAPPEEVAAGAQFTLPWEGPNRPNDYIAIVPTGAAPGALGAEGTYARTAAGSPAQLTAPTQLGQYEARYVDGQNGRTLASVPVEVTQAAARLSAATVVPPGAAMNVVWTGPGDPGDAITIVPAGAREGQIGQSAVAPRGGEVTLNAPNQSGEYEIRYVGGQTGRTLARLPLTLAQQTASLDAPRLIAPGSRFPIRFDGPLNLSDFINLVPLGAAPGTQGVIVPIQPDGTIQLQAPDALGDYEIRYVDGESGQPLASLPVILSALGGLATQIGDEEEPSPASPEATAEIMSAPVEDEPTEEDVEAEQEADTEAELEIDPQAELEEAIDPEIEADAEADLEPETDIEPESGVEAQVEPDSQIEAEPELEPEVDPAADAEADAEQDAEAEAELTEEPDAAPELDPDAVTEDVIEPETDPADLDVDAEIDSESDIIPEDDPVTDELEVEPAEVEQEGEIEPVPESEIEPESEPDLETDLAPETDGLDELEEEAIEAEPVPTDEDLSIAPLEAEPEGEIEAEAKPEPTLETDDETEPAPESDAAPADESVDDAVQIEPVEEDAQIEPTEVEPFEAEPGSTVETDVEPEPESEPAVEAEPEVEGDVPPEETASDEIGELIEQQEEEPAPTPLSASLQTVEVATPGEPVSVSWEGPGEAGDTIEITPAGGGAPVSSEAASGGAVTLIAPEEPGSYEIRYRHAATGEILASTPLTIE